MTLIATGKTARLPASAAVPRVPVVRAAVKVSSLTTLAPIGCYLVWVDRWREVSSRPRRSRFLSRVLTASGRALATGPPRGWLLSSCPQLRRAQPRCCSRRTGLARPADARWGRLGDAALHQQDSRAHRRMVRVMLGIRRGEERGERCGYKGGGGGGGKGGVGSGRTWHILASGTVSRGGQSCRLGLPAVSAPCWGGGGD